jgi:short-subunit dehydrogenase
MTQLPQKVVLITGTSSGIGKCCAEHLATRGYRVFGTQRRLGTQMQPGIELIQMDVDQDVSVADGVRTVIDKAGHLDVVINNAGWGLMGPVELTSLEEAKAQMETNFFGVLRVCRAVLPFMRQQGSGYIVNISSLAGIVGLPFSSMYSASKFALEGMTESLRLETRHQGIRVVLVEPGDFRTHFDRSRRFTSTSIAGTPYAEAFQRAQKAQEAEESSAPTPETVAILVERILQTNRPRLRYSIGKLSQRIVVPLKRLLPQRLFEWLLCIAVGC